LHDRWIKLPSKRRANLNQTSTKLKFEKLKDLVIHAIKSDNNTMVVNLLRKIQKYRQSGLSKGGEFSPENLAFKLVRNTGLLDTLYKHRNNLHSKELSIETKIKHYR
jgi:PBP1b-binding outer membrane lipoprotein LpoB